MSLSNLTTIEVTIKLSNKNLSDLGYVVATKGIRWASTHTLVGNLPRKQTARNLAVCTLEVPENLVHEVEQALHAYGLQVEGSTATPELAAVHA